MHRYVKHPCPVYPPHCHPAWPSILLLYRLYVVLRLPTCIVDSVHDNRLPAFGLHQAEHVSRKSYCSVEAANTGIYKGAWGYYRSCLASHYVAEALIVS